MSWVGLNAKCEDYGPLTACDKCSCKLLQEFNGQHYNRCNKTTRHCYSWNLHCVDSVKNEGECCPTYPNGITCLIYGQVVSVGEKIHQNPENENESSQCVNEKNYGPMVKKCTIHGYFKSCQWSSINGF